MICVSKIFAGRVQFSHLAHQRIWGRSVLRVALVFILILGITACAAIRQTLAAEMTCVQTYNNVQKINELFPSNRRPTADTCRGLLLKGPIVPGDAERFAAIVRDNRQFLHWVALWSPGGFVDDAMKIGRLIRKNLIETIAPVDAFVNLAELSSGDRSGNGVLIAPNPSISCEPKDTCHCASACFLTWAGGVRRYGSALGLHRPSTASTSFAALPPEKASILYRALLSEIDQYLSEMEVPRKFIDMMTGTPSTDMRWLKDGEEDDVSPVPSFDEWIKSVCGALNSAEKKILYEYALRAERPDMAMGLGMTNLSQSDRRLYDEINKKSSRISDCAVRRLIDARVRH